ncbi:MAG: hypothetical protein P4L63_00035 [Candidatus Pacebacteria bacterium]|nr:hypothetical protein [Candidatus Paceibacterota bacterium]
MGFLRFVLFIAIATTTSLAQASDPVTAFFAKSATDEPVLSYKGSQRLEGTGFGESGFIEVSVEFREGLFSYQITNEGGSSQVRSKALKPFLEAERNQKHPELSAFNGDNYNITLDDKTEGGLTLLNLEPRRKERALISGYLFVDINGDLIRVEGKPAKSPSFWTFNTKVIRYYSRISGVRVPTKMVSTATLVCAPSSLVVTYSYDELNGRKVKQP